MLGLELGEQLEFRFELGLRLGRLPLLERLADVVLGVQGHGHGVNRRVLHAPVQPSEELRGLLRDRDGGLLRLVGPVVDQGLDRVDLGLGFVHVVVGDVFHDGMSAMP